MKTIAITTLTLLISLSNLFAQNIDYYSGKTIIKGEDYEYAIKEIFVDNNSRYDNIKISLVK